MTECEKIQGLLSEMLDGELTEADEAAVRAHIADCPGCAALYAAFSALSEAAAEPEDVPDTLHTAVMDRVRRAEKAIKFQRNFKRWRPAAICAASLILVVGTVFAIGKSGFFAAGSAAPAAPGNETAAGVTYGAADNNMFSYSCDAADFPPEAAECPEASLKSEQEADAGLSDRMDAMYAPELAPEQLYTLTVRITGQNEDGSVAEVVESEWAEPGETVYLYWLEPPETLTEGTELTVACIWFNGETGECWDTMIAEE